MRRENAPVLTVSHCLGEGFGLATRRLHLVLLDMLSKFLWLAGTVLIFWFAGIWYLSDIRLNSSELQAFQSGLLPLVLATLVRILAANVAALGWTLVGAATISVGAWIVLEAFVHAGAFGPGDRSFSIDAIQNFGVFLLSGIARRAVLSGAGVFVAFTAFGPLLTTPVGEWSQLWMDIRWPVMAGSVLVTLLAFLMMVLDTVVRSDAVESLGFQLPQLLGIIGTIALFEASLIVASVIGIVTVLTQSAGPENLLVSAIGTVLVFFGLSLTHSYLLLARYSSVAIMRRLTTE